VCLEHSITAPTHRGQSIAPRAWTHIARVLAAEGQEAMITKVELENTPSRKAVVKAGFREMAVQRFERRGRRERVRVDVLEAPCGDALRAELTR
jgi:ribosomal protein S18 acetylase RimI-like enzyme